MNCIQILGEMKNYKPFLFKQFAIAQNNAAMKVGTDSVLLGSWATINPNERALDIGTGTGLLSLMLAQKVDGNCIIDAVEVEEGAILDADSNIKHSKWQNSIKLHNKDFNEFKTDSLYDVIITNPPFFEGLAPENATRSIARNASDKLSYKNLLERASKLLREGGRMYLILPYEYFNKVIKLGLENNLQVRNQLALKPKNDKPINRVLIEFIKDFEPEPRTQSKNHSTLIVRNAQNLYTTEHINLTKAYYLNF